MISALESAGLLRRLAALAYDALVLLGLLLLFTALIWVLRGGREIVPGTVWFQYALIVLCMLFYCWFWTHGGQTVGMRAWKIRVQSVDGGPVPWPNAAVRFITAWLSAVPVGLGYWWSLIDSQQLCWHDRLSGTRVVRDPTPER